MSVTASVETKVKLLNDADLKAKLQELRQTDNYTNFYYLARCYLYFALVLGGAIWFYHYQAAAGLAFSWNLPVTLLAIILVGAGQHQLTGLTHEASHHILFRNRYLNELISDWFCSFPLFSSTHAYRLQHLAHHQFVNDPVRDPDVSQLRGSGHWLDFPLARGEFLWVLVKQLWLPNLIRYMRIRARFSTVPSENNPYQRRNWKPSKIPLRVGIGYIVGLTAILTVLVRYGERWLLAIVPLLCWAAIVSFYALIPERLYFQSRVHAVISSRVMTLMRMSFITLLFTGLAWATLLTDEPVALYYFLLWIVPIFTSLSFLMLLRQIVQHGNGGRGWLTNTRIFFVHRLINFAVFPIGQDYHLPHHLFATVPHFRLGQLHELLLEYPEYREQATIVEGYFLPPHRVTGWLRGEPGATRPSHPTVVDVLGPAYAPHDGEVYIDDTVLDGVRVDEKQEILREGRTA
jgi:fatty acid desaturase